MSTTLNAEELAAKRWPQYGIEREVCATTIREHSQPIADERDELISCIPEGYMVHSGGNAIEALRFLVASYRVTIDEHNQWRDAANELQKERDELREALKWMVKEAEFKEKVARYHGYLGGLTVDDVMECLADVQGFVLPPVMRQRVRSRLTAKAKGE